MREYLRAVFVQQSKKHIKFLGNKKYKMRGERETLAVQI